MATDRSPGGLEVTLAVLSAAAAALYFAGAPGQYGIFLVAVGEATAGSGSPCEAPTPVL